MSATGRFWGKMAAWISVWMRSVVHRGRVEREMDEEIAFHIASRAADLEREGLTAKEALRRARVEFGSAAAHKHGMQVSLGLRPLDEFVADLRYAARLLAKHRGFTAVTVLSLALAIGANSAIFSLANEVLFARLDVPHAEQLRSLHMLNDERGLPMGEWNTNETKEHGVEEVDGFSYPAFRELARRSAVLQPLFGYQDLYGVTLSRAGVARQVGLEMVSGNYYTQMEVRPEMGRGLLPADDRLNAPMVAVISHGLWERVFGGSKDVVGRAVRLDGYSATIVGVNPAGFTGAQSVEFSPDIFVPLSAVAQLAPMLNDSPVLTTADLAWVKVAGRIAPGIHESAAEAELTVALQAETRATQEVKRGQTLPTVKLRDGSQGANFAKVRFAQPIYVLLGMVGLVLLLACVNVANLMLSRARVRARELSVRLALGAGRARLFRQMLTECLLLASMGGLLGFVLAYLVRNAIPQMLWSGADGPHLDIPFDWKVFAFTAGVTLMSALVSGVAPAWQAARSQPGAALKESGTAVTGRRHLWGSKGMVGLQVALSLILVVGSTLFLRTLVNLGRIHTGFNAKNVLLFDIDLPPLRYPAPKNSATLGQIVEAIRHVPGVEDATFGLPLLANSDISQTFLLEHTLVGHPLPNVPGGVSVVPAATDFFQTLQIPLLAGRAFSQSDLTSGRPVAVINKTLAGLFFPNSNPIGQRFRYSSKAPWVEIIGICGDTLYDNPHGTPPPIHFDLYTNSPGMGGTTFMVRSRLAPDALVPSLRQIVAQIDPDVPLNDIRTQEEQIRQDTQQERLMADLTAGFGLLALALACAGVYGVLSYSVSERTREIGIRLALGASQRLVRQTVLREALWLAAGGIGVGMAVTLLLARSVRSLLFGIAPTDPLSLAGAAGVLLLVAALAAWVPARRAAKVDPLEALRHE